MKYLYHFLLGGIILLLSGGTLANEQEVNLPRKYARHPLIMLHQQFQEKLMLADLLEDPNAPRIIQEYLQEVGAYFQENQVAYQAHLDSPEEMFLEILPGRRSIFNRMAFDLAQDNFALHYDGPANLEATARFEDKMFVVDLANHILHLRSMAIPSNENLSWAQLKFRSASYFSEREMIQLYHHELAPFLFANKLFSLDDGPIPAAEQIPAIFPDGLPTLDGDKVIFLSNVQTFSTSSAIVHHSTVDLYHRLNNYLQNPPPPDLQGKVRRALDNKYRRLLGHLTMKILDLNLIVYFLLHRPGQTTLKVEGTDALLTVVPFSQIPHYQIQLYLTSTSNLRPGDPGKALLAEPHFQKLYFYFEQLYFLLRRAYGDMFHLAQANHRRLTAALDQLWPVINLPIEIQQRPGADAFEESWAERVRELQIDAYQTLHRRLHFGGQKVCRASLTANIFKRGIPSPKNPHYSSLTPMD